MTVHLYFRIFFLLILGALVSAIRQRNRGKMLKERNQPDSGRGWNYMAVAAKPNGTDPAELHEETPPSLVRITRNNSRQNLSSGNL
ncbi:MAG: hypothetical protein IKP49_08245 [Treponema sp.]|nr:hypothetical protein [Treponema sp.]MBR6913892.1 hypothetical protein [Treponema sp.]